MRPAKDKPAKRFAPVMPIDLLQKLGSFAGNYHLPLAHDVLKFPKEYSDFFMPMSEDADRVVIMDNSVIELGGSVDIKKLLLACEIVKATHIVLPDVLQNGPETIKMSLEAFDELDKMTEKDTPDICVVPQGSTLEEWIACAESLEARIPVDMWCIPRNFEVRLGSRNFACELISCIDCSDTPIHLLGFSDWIFRDMISARHPQVIGIDSAVPIRLGQEKKMLQLTLDAGKRGDWWEKTNKFTPLQNDVTRNLKIIRGWLNPDA